MNKKMMEMSLTGNKDKSRWVKKKKNDENWKIWQLEVSPNRKNENLKSWQSEVSPDM